MVKKCAEPKETKEKNFFMPKIALAPDGIGFFRLARGKKCSAQPEGAGFFSSDHSLRILIGFYNVTLLPALRGAFRFLSLIHSYIVALFSALLSAYNVSRVKSTTYNKNRQQKDCHTIPLQIGLFIALFCGKSGSEDSESHLTHLKLNSYDKANVKPLAFFISRPGANRFPSSEGNAISVVSNAGPLLIMPERSC